jgi:zinc D-Ala-D-Ala carboxypeptidase
MEEISDNITYAEATNSPTAKRLGFKNEPNKTQKASMATLAENIFEPLRKGLGDDPLRITSFFRSEESNTAVGGSKTSQHCKGEAMDIEGVESTNAEVFEYIKDHLPFDQLIWEFGNDDEPAWVHVSHASRNRAQILKAVKKNGKTTYALY